MRTIGVPYAGLVVRSRGVGPEGHGSVIMFFFFLYETEFVDHGWDGCENKQDPLRASWTTRIWFVRHFLGQDKILTSTISLLIMYDTIGALHVFPRPQGPRAPGTDPTPSGLLHWQPCSPCITSPIQFRSCLKTHCDERVCTSPRRTPETRETKHTPAFCSRWRVTHRALVSGSTFMSPW